MAESETILLVEDDESVRKLTKQLLEAQGYTVVEAENGLTALQIALFHPKTIHLLITDMIMPGMQGRELAMRVLPQRPGIKIIYVTGYADATTINDASVLEKPFTPDELLRIVGTVLAGSRNLPISQAG